MKKSIPNANAKIKNDCSAYSTVAGYIRGGCVLSPNNKMALPIINSANRHDKTISKLGYRFSAF